MGSPISLLGKAHAFARDFPRDEMPEGFLWDVVDFVPASIDTILTSRGAWSWGSADLGADALAGIYAEFLGNDQLLVQAGDRLKQIDTTTLAVTDRGSTAVHLPAQNPVQLGQTVIHFNAQTNAPNTSPPQLWRVTGAPISANALHKHAPVGAVYKAMMVSGGAVGEENLVRFSVPAKNLEDADSFDINSVYPTSQKVTAIAALRSLVLVFHASSTERLRGAKPASSVAGQPGDMVLEEAFDRVGCHHPKTIAYWRDNVIFADERGVHLTDGAILRSLTTEGGIATYWRMLFQGADTISATTFMDYYILTVRHTPLRPPIPLLWAEADGSSPGRKLEVVADVPDPPPPTVRPPVPSPNPDYTTTLVCDLNTRRWFRFQNINAGVHISAGGSLGMMERSWSSILGSNKLARISPIFFPDQAVNQVDANGVAVQPRLETPWYRLGEEGRKRVRFAYLSYDARGEAPATNPLQLAYITSFPQEADYFLAGTMPLTTRYSRYRLPVNKFPYGVAFYVQVTNPIHALRLFDIALEAQAAERSRI